MKITLANGQEIEGADYKGVDVIRHFIETDEVKEYNKGATVRLRSKDGHESSYQVSSMDEARSEYRKIVEAIRISRFSEYLKCSR